MNVKQLYSIARFLSNHFNIPGYDKQDLVQECVLKAWLKGGDKPFAYVRRLMINHLINLANSSRYYAELTELHIPRISDRVVWIPSDPRLKKVCIAMIDCGLDVKRASEFLGWSYWSTRKVWRDVKVKMREYN